jgi:hypothetical protein
MKARETGDKRTVFRVRVAGDLLDAEVVGVGLCPIMDASAEGLGIVCPIEFCVGDRLEIAIEYESQVLKGHAEVRYSRPLPSGKFRCGLRACEAEQGLRDALHAVALQAERRQLRRKASRRAALH